jgi:iron complex transport system ATP-binding protein
VNLQAHRLDFGYPGLVLGRELELSLARGEILCLLGPNGSGKTTLFRTLLGLIPALGGEVRIGAEPIARLSRRDVARRIAYVPQAHLVPFPFSALEVVLMGRSVHLGMFDSPGRADRAAAMDPHDALGIAALALHDYSRRSGGPRQLVLIARALAQRAELLVMDEPTASLDFGNRSRVLAHLMALRERGLGVAFSTHEPDHAFAVADRAAVLHGGELIACGPPAEVVTGEVLGRAYGLPVRIELLSAGRRVCVPDPAGGPATTP